MSRTLTAWAALFLLVVAGCSPTSSSSPTTSGPPASIQSTSTAAAVTRPIVVVFVNPDLGDLDPAQDWGFGAPIVLAHTYDRLFQMGGQPLAPQPMLAADVPTTQNGGISADGLVYTIHLRTGATFHDGTTVDASAVVSSFERIKKINQGPVGVSAKWIAKMQAVDPQTVRFTLSQPLSDFLPALASGWGAYIVSPTAIKAHEAKGDSAHDWLQTHDAGSGPYTMSSFDQAAKQVTLDRVDNWWGWSDGPHIGRAVIRFGVESATARLMLERGDADFLAGPTTDDFNKLKNESGMVAQNYLGLEQIDILFNNSVKPFNDIKVRQAIQYTLDRDTINQGVFGGYLGKMIGVISESYPEAYPPTTTYDFDLTKAQQLLAQAGYDASNPLRFTITPPHYWSGDSEVLQIWQSDLAKIGVTLDIREVDPATFGTAWYTCKADTIAGTPNGFAGGFTGDYPSSWELLWASYSSPNGNGQCGNSYYAKNEQATTLIDKVARETDTAARKPLMEQLNQVLTDDAEALWIGTRPSLVVMRDVVKGYSYTDMNYVAYVPLAAMSLER